MSARLIPWTLRRKAARVVLLDRDARVFLVNASDPVDPRKEPWWEIPGGGMHAGESSAEAARRELYEETGISGVEMGPCIWVQHVEFDFGGFHFDQDEWIHVGWCDGGSYRPQQLEALEAAAFEDARWWTLPELLASQVPLLPPALRVLLGPIVTGDLPTAPLDLNTLTAESPRWPAP